MRRTAQGLSQLRLMVTYMLPLGASELAYEEIEMTMGWIVGALLCRICGGKVLAIYLLASLVIWYLT